MSGSAIPSFAFRFRACVLSEEEEKSTVLDRYIRLLKSNF